MTNTAGLRDCPGCGANDATDLPAYSQGQWRVGQCRACDFVFLQNPPAYEALEEDFAWEKTFVEKKKMGGSTPLSRPLRRLRAFLGLAGNRSAGAKRYHAWFGKGAVLDIGCGDRVRVTAPLVPYGIELSRAMQADADRLMRAQGGMCLHASGADGVWKFEPDTFSGIIMHSYLEHEVAVDRVLQGCFRALVPGGRAYVRVPNFGSLNRRIIGARWCGFRHPDHVNYFTRDTLQKSAAKAGFKTALLNRLRLAVDDNIHVLLTKPLNDLQKATP